MSVLILVVLFWIVPIFVTTSMGKGKNRAGFGYGFLLGWIGVIILGLLPALSPLSLAEELASLERRQKQYPSKSYPEERARLVARIAEEARYPCPFCKEGVRGDAVVCPHCQRDIVPQSAGSGS